MNRQKWLLMGKAAALTLLLCLLTAASFTAQAANKPKLSKKTLSLQLGKSATLKLSGTSKTPKWSVSDEDVISLKKVTKKKYKVTAEGVGTAKVTVKAGKKKAVCTVTVTVPKPAVPSQRKKIYSGDENLDYLLKLMIRDAKVTEDMTDEQIAYGIFKWMAKNCVYEYEGTMKYGSKAKTKYPPYGLKLIYDLTGKESEIAAYKKECDALEEAGEITYSMEHVKSGGSRLYVKDKDHPYSVLGNYQHLTGTCSYMASIFTNLCEYMGLKGGINIGEIYSSSKKGFTEHYISFIYLNGKKYYVDPGSAVHSYTRRKSFEKKFFKLSSSFIKKNYKLGSGWDEY